jgi:hypothetical protein
MFRKTKPLGSTPLPHIGPSRQAVAKYRSRRFSAGRLIEISFVHEPPHFRGSRSQFEERLSAGVLELTAG